MKVLVTGGTGYIGRKLVKSLCQRAYTVSVLTRRTDCVVPDGVQIAKGDLIAENYSLDPHLAGVDIVFHCAGELQNESLMRSLHVDGTNRLLKATINEAKKTNRIIHWVQLSSVGTYGPAIGAAKTHRVITEISVPHPVGEYEITKTQSDALVMKAAETGPITYTIIRPSNVFSADMPNQSLRALARLINKKLFFYIGRPGAVASYIHADDVVELLVRCADDERAKGEIFNISNDCLLEDMINGISNALNIKKPGLRLPEFIVKAFVTYIGEIVKLPLTKERISALTSRTNYPMSKLKYNLGFIPRITVPEAISEVVSTIE